MCGVDAKDQVTKERSYGTADANAREGNEKLPWCESDVSAHQYLETT